jgi:hypothetical protein
MPLPTSPRAPHPRPVQLQPIALPPSPHNQSSAQADTPNGNPDLPSPQGPGGRPKEYRGMLYPPASIPALLDQLQPQQLVSYGYTGSKIDREKGDLPPITRQQSDAATAFKSLLQKAHTAIEAMHHGLETQQSEQDFFTVTVALHRSVLEMRALRVEPLPAVKAWLLECDGKILESQSRKYGLALLNYQLPHDLRKAQSTYVQTTFENQSFNTLAREVQAQVEQIFTAASTAPLHLPTGAEPVLAGRLGSDVRLSADCFTHIEHTPPGCSASVRVAHMDRARALAVAIDYIDCIRGQPEHHILVENGCAAFLDSEDMVGKAFGRNSLAPEVCYAIRQAARWEGLADGDIPVPVLACVGRPHMQKEYNQYLRHRTEKSAEKFHASELCMADEESRAFTTQLIRQTSVLGTQSAERPKEAQFLDMMHRAYALFAPFNTLEPGSHDQLWSRIETDLQRSKTHIDAGIQSAVKEFIFDAIASPAQRNRASQTARQTYAFHTSDEPSSNYPDAAYLEGTPGRKRNFIQRNFPRKYTMRMERRGLMKSAVMPRPPYQARIFPAGDTRIERHGQFYTKQDIRRDRETCSRLREGGHARIFLADVQRSNARCTDTQETIVDCVHRAETSLKKTFEEMRQSELHSLFSDLHLARKKSVQAGHPPGTDMEQRLRCCLDEIQIRFHDLQAEQEAAQMRQSELRVFRQLGGQLDEKMERMLSASAIQPRLTDRSLEQADPEGEIFLSSNSPTHVVEVVRSASTPHYVEIDHRPCMDAVMAHRIALSYANHWHGQPNHNTLVEKVCKKFAEKEPALGYPGGYPTFQIPRGLEIATQKMVEAARWHGLAKCEIPAARLATMSLFTEKENTRYLKDRSKKSAERYLEYIGNDKDVVRLIMQTKVVGEKSKHRSQDAHFLDLVDRVCTLAARPFFQIPGMNILKVDGQAILTTIANDLAQTRTTIDPRVMRAVEHFMANGWLDEALGADLLRVHERRGRQNIGNTSTAGAARTAQPVKEDQDQILDLLEQLKILCIEVPEGASKSNMERARINAGKYLMASVDVRRDRDTPIATLTLDSAIQSDTPPNMVQCAQHYLQLQERSGESRRAPLVAYLNKLFELFEERLPYQYEMCLMGFSDVLTDPINLQIFSNLVVGQTYSMKREAAALFAGIPLVRTALSHMATGSVESSTLLRIAQHALQRRNEFLENLADSTYSVQEKEHLLRVQCGGYEPVLDHNEYVFGGQEIYKKLYAYEHRTQLDCLGNLQPRPEPSKETVEKVNIDFLMGIVASPNKKVKNAAEVYVDQIILKQRAYLADQMERSPAKV